MCQGPAGQTGLKHKGRIEPGYDADFSVFAPDETFVVDVNTLHHKNAISPYDGMPLTGVVRGTWLRGQAVDEGQRGRLLQRGAQA
jgi:allantoinase